MKVKDMENPLEGLSTIGADILARNLQRVTAQLEENRYGDNPPARLIAVTKTVSVETIRSLHTLGVREIAENRSQVLTAKLPMLPQDVKIHFIGRLQTNKVKAVLPHIALLHSMDRMELAREVHRQALLLGSPTPVLVQVNVSGESQKAGMPPEEVLPFLREVRSMEGLKIRGLMSIMPLGAPQEQLTGWFRQMRSLFEQIRDLALEGVEMTELSMGMTQDYALAAREGATMVRVGTGLYRE